ncbi:MAG TPA: DNA double-strand break repair nuclease NurA [Acidimicrobiia bacterium]|nr:DNA double-strand break repair nuclease NurA [Acidimicrobiia bacterium]
MRFTVEAWDPDYGAPSDADLADSTDKVDPSVELSPDQWRPLLPECAPAEDILFVDGVRRVDANLWIDREGLFPGFGLAATYAAGAVRCNGGAKVVASSVRRGIFTSGPAESIETKVGRYEVMSTKGSTPEELWLGIQERMGDLEGEVAADHADAALVVVDGPLSHRRHLEGAVGYVKTQHVQYLPDDLRATLGTLPVGHRTPLFLTTTSWSRFSWYLRLANDAGPAGGLVRCEVKADMTVADAARLAHLVSASLPRYASARHKDPRAPQNLYPIGGLERELRRRLGDRDLVIRALRLAAA